MAGKSEGRGGKDIEQTAQLSRRGAMSCESEEKDERGRYAAKKVSVCGGRFFKCKKTEKAQECSYLLSVLWL